MCTYLGDSEDIAQNDLNSDPAIAFDITIDYERGYVISTSVYVDEVTRNTASGYAERKYRNGAGLLVFTVRVDGEFYYNGSTCNTTSATATFTPALLSAWTSSPSASSGKSGSRAYARAYGTATAGNQSQDYSVYLYCDVNGNLSPT